MKLPDAKMSAGSLIPQAMLFRAFVAVVLSRVDFPHVKKSTYARQINEVLSGSVNLSLTDI